ncbi:MAG: ATP-dependent DNA helicase [Sedimenticola sp.]
MANINDILREKLSGEQYDAAVDMSGEVLTLACAGSGKSTTLAYRIAFLVANGADPMGIVAFTFTEKAAESIKRNVAKALVAGGMSTSLLGAMYIGTIHSYCQHVLGMMDARYRQFDVLDANRLILYIMSRYWDRLAQLGQQRGARYFKQIKETSRAWSIMNEEMVRLEDVVAEDELLGEVLSTLQVSLDRDQFIDFSSMIRLVVDGLEENDPGALAATSSLEHLMVDEYQDVNTSQERLIRALHRHSKTLFVVGDDDQSIYGWRGADVTNILTFEERFPNATRHTLATNYRSTRAIVETADNLVAAQLGANRFEKNPNAAELDLPRDYRILWFNTRQDEATWAADRVVELLETEYIERNGKRRGLTPGDFAILMRSTREPEANGNPRHSAFTDALEQRGIRVTLEAGGSPFDVPQVSVLRDTFALLRNGSPTRGEVQTHFSNIVQPAYQNANFQQFATVMAEWGREIHTPPGGVRRRVFPQNLVHELLEAFGIQAGGYPNDVMNAIGIFSRMIQDVEAVYVSIDSSNRFSQLLNFLENIADAGYDLSSDDLVQMPDAVTVSTVHKVKGLEYPVVFVVDVENSRFPKIRRAYNGWLPSNLIQDALNRNCYCSNHDEEARLFYTALTRAERFLYVTGCENLPGGKQRRKRSNYALSLVDEEISDNPNGFPVGLDSAPAEARLAETSLPTSYSEIRYYLRCPKDYQYRYRFGFTPAIVEMFGFGQTVHAAVGKLHETFTHHAPSGEEAEQVAESVFHLKHIPPSRDPQNRPGGYENAKDSARSILRHYAESYGDDFIHRREVEARFEIPVEQAVISGAIDLLIHEDDEGNIVDASVVDFKAMKGGEAPAENEKLNWTELAIQVQLYAKAAREVLGEPARTGAVHLLKDDQRVAVPVDDEAVAAAVENVVWAVDRVLMGDFPMRPEHHKCSDCDFQKLCPKRAENFQISQQPPEIHLPDGNKQHARAFSEFEP